MKVLVSWLRELVDIPVDSATLAQDLHLAGFEVASVMGTVPNGTESVPLGTVPDAVIDFEITANRPDCLSLIGIAREVATKYGVYRAKDGISERAIFVVDKDGRIAWSKVYDIPQQPDNADIFAALKS